jgi:CheY-like chemotaxis protein
MYNASPKKSYPGKNMSILTKHQGQFIILMIGDIDSKQPALKQEHQNIITANNLNDIISHITTTQFDLILLDLTVSGLNFITRIKDPDCINHNTPIIALVNQVEDPLDVHYYPIELAGSLLKPFTEDQLNKLIDPLRTKSLALNYIQLILNKTKNNQRLALTIFEKLFEELPMQIIDIKAALENRQYDLAHEITHKLNGSVSFCGLWDIQHPANALESNLLNKNSASLNQHFLKLQQNTLNFTRHQKSIMAHLDQMLHP